MKVNLAHKIAEFQTKHQHLKQWRSVVGILAALIVLGVSSVLILPAITMESQETAATDETLSETSVLEEGSPGLLEEDLLTTEDEMAEEALVEADAQSEDEDTQEDAPADRMQSVTVADSRVTATYNADALPEEAAFSGALLDADSADETYWDLFDITESYLASRDMRLTDARFYDFSFQEDEAAIEPEGSVNVTILFDQPVAGDAEASWRLLHMDHGRLADLTTVTDFTYDENDDLTALSFQTSSFSPYILAQGIALEQAEEQTEEPTAEPQGEPTRTAVPDAPVDLETYLAEIREDNPGSAKDIWTKIVLRKPGFATEVEWDPENIWHYVGTYYLQFSLSSGGCQFKTGTYTYQLPSGMTVKEAQGGTFTDLSNLPNSTWELNTDGLLTLHILDLSYDLRCTLQCAVAFRGEDPTEAKIVKSGAFNANTGMVDFNISATLSAHYGEDYQKWVIEDDGLKNTTAFSLLFSANPDLTLDGTNLTLRLTYLDGSKKDEDPVVIPPLSAATANDNLAYVLSYRSDDPANHVIAPIYNPKTYIVLLNRCECNHTCTSLTDILGSAYSSYADAGWCACWCADANTRVDVSYTDVQSYQFINPYRENWMGNAYLNTANLYDNYNASAAAMSNTALSEALRQTADTSVSIPQFISLEGPDTLSALTQNRGEYVATVNPTKIDFSKAPETVLENGVVKPRTTIRNTLDNLTLNEVTKVKQVDAEGNIVELVAGTDYTLVATDASGQKLVDGDGNEYFDIYLANPGPYTYLVEYTAEFSGVLPGLGQTVPVEAVASLPFLYEGYCYSDNAPGALSASSAGLSGVYEFHLLKTEVGDPNRTLEGAVYALYSYKTVLGRIELVEQARLTTNSAGYCTFVATSGGLEFNPNKAYCIKEITPPEGYNLDTTEHWVYRTSDTKDGVYYNAYVEEEWWTQAARENATLTCLSNENDQIGIRDVLVVEDEAGYVLPMTGGVGTLPLFVGSILVICSFVLFINKKNPRKGGSN